MADSFTEKRRHRRVDVVIKVTDAFSTSHYYYSRDLSAGGMFLESLNPYPVGTLLHLEFSLPDGQPDVRATAEVMRSVTTELGDYQVLAGMGIKFLDLSPQDVERLKNYIEELSRGF